MTGFKTGKNVCDKCDRFKTNHDNKACPFPDYHIIPDYLLNDPKWWRYKQIHKANKI